jgi:acetyl esterase/lipase
MMLSLRDARHALPAGAVCISPSTDLAKTGESIHARAHMDPLVTVPSTFAHAKRYLGEKGDPRHPLASPLYAELKGLPPLLVMVGTHEILHDDSTRLAAKAQAAGVDVTLEIAQDMVHIWPFFAAILPEAQQAVDRIGAWVQEHA